MSSTTLTATETQPPPSGSLRHEPALDGVRALAVMLVLLFHGGVSWMHGGYVGVSVFFTLSGFLITRLLLTEHSRSGGIDLGRFYARRLRRLLPAGLLCLALVIVAAEAGWFAGIQDLRRDVTGALLQVANWVSLGGSDSYAGLLARTGGEPSPVAHFWSLAIEEQFYWLWPLVLLFVVLRGRPSARATTVRIGALTAAAALAAPLVARLYGADAAYWATPARVGEILVGGLLAAIVHERSGSGRPVDRRVAWLGVPGLVGILAAATTFPASSGPAYSGLMPGFAVASALLIAALLVDSPLRRAFALAPMAACGRVSYGLYLYHWPIFLVLDEARTGLDGIALLTLRCVVTGLVATASYVLVEQPIRRQTWRPRVTVALAAGATAAVVGAAAVAVAGPATYWQVDSRDGSAAVVVAPPPADALEPLQTVAPPPPTTPIAAVAPVTTAAPLAPSRPVRMVLVGDSTAEATGVGLLSWAGSHPDLASVVVRSSPGCGMLIDGFVLADGEADFTTQCHEILDGMLPGDVQTFQPDVLVIMVTLHDVIDRVWDENEGLLSPLDPRFQERLVEAYRQRAAGFRDLGVDRVVWVVPPVPDFYWDAVSSPYEDPARFDVQRQAIRAAAAGDPSIRVVDLRAWADSTGLAVDRDARPDGLHWSPEAATQLAEDWLGQQLIDAALT